MDYAENVREPHVLNDLILDLQYRIATVLLLSPRTTGLANQLLICLIVVFLATPLAFRRSLELFECWNVPSLIVS